MRTTLCGMLIVTALACADAQSAPGQSQPPTPDTVVAEVAGRKITLKELDDRWQSADPAERARVTQMLYQSRRNVLEQMMGDALIEDAAKAAITEPQSEVEHLRAEVERLSAEPATPRLDAAARTADRYGQELDRYLDVVRERPLTAIGVAALTGFLVGRTFSGNRYVYRI